MDSFKRFVRGTFDKGGVLALGAVCLLLYRQQYFPRILGPVSYGILAAGAFGFARYVIMDYGTTNEDARYQELLRELEERLPEIEEDPKLSEELRESCFRFMSMRECLEAWRKDPSLVEDRISILERLLQKTQETSSYATRGSTVETLSSMRTAQGSSLASPREEDMPLVHDVEVEGQTDVGDVQQEKPQTQQEGGVENRQEKILQMAPEEITEAIQDDIPENVLNELYEAVLEMTFGKVIKNISEEVLGEETAEEVLDVEEAVEEVAEEEVDKAVLEVERAEEILGEEAAEEVLEVEEAIEEAAEEEAARNMVVEEVAKDVLEIEVAEESLLQEAAKEVTEEEAAKVMQMGEVPKEVTLLGEVPKMIRMEEAKTVTEGKATQKKPVE